jgi:hypothetical protein
MTPNEVYLRKAEEIGRILSEPEVDLWKLREFALSEGGLVNGEKYSHIQLTTSRMNG